MERGNYQAMKSICDHGDNSRRSLIGSSKQLKQWVERGMTVL